MPLRPWTKTATTPLGQFRIFNLRSDTKISPRTGVVHDFFVIECVNWVNVVALTADDRLVMVNQYRHGSNTIEHEVPGGVMDASDASPEATAVRELREETGYEGEGATVIGRVFPNPAIMTNTCFTVLIQNCRLVHAPSLDSAEDLTAETVPANSVADLVSTGRIRHALVVAALYHFESWRRGK